MQKPRIAAEVFKKESFQAENVLARDEALQKRIAFDKDWLDWFSGLEHHDKDFVAVSFVGMATEKELSVIRRLMVTRA